MRWRLGVEVGGGVLIDGRLADGCEAIAASVWAALSLRVDSSWGVRSALDGSFDLAVEGRGDRDFSALGVVSTGAGGALLSTGGGGAAVGGGIGAMITGAFEAAIDGALTAGTGTFFGGEEPER